MDGKDSDPRMSLGLTGHLSQRSPPDPVGPEATRVSVPAPWAQAGVGSRAGGAWWWVTLVQRESTCISLTLGVRGPLLRFTVSVSHSALAGVAQWIESLPGN